MSTTSPEISHRRAAHPTRVRPLLRGWSHVFAALAALPAVWVLVSRAAPGVASTAAAVYGASLAALLVVSAAYHRIYWPSAVRHVIGRIDHAAIFLLIAGTYTPFGLLLGPGLGHWLLGLVWLGAAAGIVVVVGFPGVPKPVRAGLYVLLGWFVLPAVPALYREVGASGLGLLFAGGAAYTLGAVIYGARRPDPFPQVFGFHEIFHLLVVVAAACHFVVVEAAVAALG